MPGCNGQDQSSSLRSKSRLVCPVAQLVKYDTSGDKSPVSSCSGARYLSVLDYLIPSIVDTWFSIYFPIEKQCSRIVFVLLFMQQPSVAPRYSVLKSMLNTCCSSILDTPSILDDRYFSTVTTRNPIPNTRYPSILDT